jgi:hypothetical protein
MAKKKFELTSDLIKVESEPNTYDLNSRDNNKKPFKAIDEPKEQINLKISKCLKNDFQIWCINNDKNMTEGLEEALLKLIQKKTPV